MPKKDPMDYPMFPRDNKVYSFLDCTCDGTCKGRDCLYCAFDLEDLECPGEE